MRTTAGVLAAVALGIAGAAPNAGAQQGAPADAGARNAAAVDTAGREYRAPDGVRVHYTDAGTGPAVVLLHGFLNDAATWYRTPLYRALRDAGFRVVAPDLRGNGASDHPTRLAAYADDAEARDVAGIADALRLTRYAVVGYSRGSIIASRVLVRDPRVVAAVLGGMGAGFTDPEWPRRLAVYRVLAGEPIPADSAAPFAGMLRAADERGLDRRVLALQQRAQPSTSRAEFARVRRPVLVIAGDADQDNGSAAELAGLIPGATRATVPGDHGGALRSAEFARAVVGFLRAPPAAAAPR